MTLEHAFLSLEGLSVGDAFGASLFFPKATDKIERRELLPAPWRWTDDTQMALSVVEELRQREWIDQDSLARRLASRYLSDPARGYGSGTRQILERIAHGEYFRVVAKAAFNGGSFGPSAATRAAPAGAYFAGNPWRAAREARLTAGVTHMHAEGIAGAEAVAVAAALVAQPHPPAGRDLLLEIAALIPDSLLRNGIVQAAEIAPDALDEAVERLGTGQKYSALDTVPYCLWCAAYHLDDYEQALWWTVSGMGNRDTNCAIVGGIVVLAAPNIPQE